MCRFIAVSLGIVLFTSARLPAQTPIETARAFLQAQSDRQWLVMADLVDSASMRVIRSIGEKTVESIERANRPELRAAMDSMGVGNMAKAVDGIQAMLGPGGLLRFSFANVADAAAMRAMTDRELTASWLQAKSISYMMELTTTGMLRGMIDRMPPGASAQMQTEVQRAQSMRVAWDVLGEVREGDTLAHVIYRVAGGTPPASTGVLTLRSTRGRWYVYFTNPNDQLAPMSTLALRALQDRNDRP